MRNLIIGFLGSLVLTSGFAMAQSKLEEGAYGPLDNYPESLLYNAPIEVAPNVWSAIGATQPPTYENSGHNNNLSFVIGDESVLVVNGSAAYLLAKALHEEIKKITDKKIAYVVNENGQGHAMLGNNYWKEQGAKIIAQEDGAEVFEANSFQILERMKNYNREKSEGTEIVAVDETFAEEMTLNLGNREVLLKNFGPAHSPGDIGVIVPDANVIIAGDMAFHIRMLPVFSDTHTGDWLESFAVFADYAKDMIVVPGHGGPTDMATVDKYTRGYLEYVRAKIRVLIDEGKGLEDAFLIDQSPYKDLHTFDELATKNAGYIFTEMEFE